MHLSHPRFVEQYKSCILRHRGPSKKVLLHWCKKARDETLHEEKEKYTVKKRPRNGESLRHPRNLKPVSSQMADSTCSPVWKDALEEEIAMKTCQGIYVVENQ